MMTCVSRSHGPSLTLDVYAGAADMPDAPLLRPPFDRQCAEVLARLPEFPPFTVESLDAIRRPPPGFDPPTDADLARGGRFDVSRRSVPNPRARPTSSWSCAGR